MTMTATELLQQLDWEPVCQLGKCHAGHPPATHTATMLPCGCVYLACTDCAARMNGRTNEMLAKNPRRHRSCKGFVFEVRIEPLP